jgi:hypothetical protein
MGKRGGRRGERERKRERGGIGGDLSKWCVVKFEKLT